MSERQKFSKEFKLEAVRLLQQSDKPASELALELGVPRNRLYKWQIIEPGSEVSPHNFSQTSFLSFA